MAALSLFLAFSVLPATAIAQLSDAATLPATIKSEAAYSLLPGCINQCIWDIGDNDTPKIGGDLAIHLSCSTPWINGCYCRGASADSAYAFLTSCFSFLCSTPAASDIDAGISIYTSYCSHALGAAYTPNAIPEPAPAVGVTTAAPPRPTGGPAATSRPTSAIPKQTGKTDTAISPGETAAPTASNDDGKIAGLSQGAFIGVVVSASCSVLGLLFGIAFKIWKHKKQTRVQQQQQQEALTYNYQAKA